MKKKYSPFIFAGLSIGILLSLIFLLGFFSSARLAIADKLYLGSRANDDIVIVAIDNKSLQEYGRWPWSRGIHSDLIRKISQSKPAIIAIDVNFAEKSDETADSSLASSIKDSGVVVLPLTAEVTTKNNYIEASSISFPMDSLKQAAYGLGIANTPADSDGVFRRLPLEFFSTDKNGFYPSFAYVVTSKYLEKQNYYQPNIPKDSRGRMMVDFVGKPKSITTISSADILDGKNTTSLEGKIVLIGATASDLHDEILTPTSASLPMSGVEIHANAVNTILTGQYLENLSPLFQIGLIMALSIFINLVFSVFKVKTSTTITFFSLILVVLTAVFVFDYGIIIDIFFLTFSILFSYLSGLAIKYLVTSREKHQIKNTFSRYVSQHVIDELLADPKKLKLGGEKKEISILFSDIRGFTTISEKLSPEQLVSVLNIYLTAMTDTIMDNRGVIDKFIGDAIMAFWGAPLPDADHATNACNSALLMLKTLDILKPRLLDEYGIELNIGIGVNSGEVVVGNMGSDKRFDYTVMGDNVNLSSRLEGLTKQYGVRIIVSEFTREKAGDKFVYREIDRVVVKGKKEAVRIFELVCKRSEADGETARFIEDFSRGIALYQQKKWGEAMALFSEIKQNHPDDTPCQIYIDRCNDYSQNPPENDWDGVYHLKTK